MHAEDKGSKCTFEGKHILILFHDINTATKIKTDCEISVIGQTGNNLPQLELIFQGNLFHQFFPGSKRQKFAKIEKPAPTHSSFYLFKTCFLLVVMYCENFGRILQIKFKKITKKPYKNFN